MRRKVSPHKLKSRTVISSPLSGDDPDSQNLKFLKKTLHDQKYIKEEYQLQKIEQFYSKTLDQGSSEKLDNSMTLLKKYWIAQFLIEVQRKTQKQKYSNVAFPQLLNLINNFNITIEGNCNFENQNPQDISQEFTSLLNQNMTVEYKLFLKYFTFSVIPSFYHFFLTSVSDRYFDLIENFESNERISRYFIQTLYLIPGFVQYIKISIKPILKECPIFEKELTKDQLQKFISDVCIKLSENINLCPKYCLRFFNHQPEHRRKRFMYLFTFIFKRPELFQLRQFYQMPIDKAYRDKLIKTFLDNIKSNEQFDTLLTNISNKENPQSDEQRTRNQTFGQYTIFNYIDQQILKQIPNTTIQIFQYFQNPENITVQSKQTINLTENDQSTYATKPKTVSVKMQEYHDLLLISEPLPAQFSAAKGEHISVANLLRPYLVDQGNLNHSDAYEIGNGYIHRKQLFDSIFDSTFDDFRNEFLLAKSSTLDQSALSQKVHSTIKMRRTILKLQELMNNINFDVFHVLNSYYFRSNVIQAFSKRSNIFTKRTIHISEIDSNINVRSVDELINNPKLIIDRYNFILQSLNSCEYFQNPNIVTRFYQAPSSHLLNITSDCRKYILIKIVEKIDFNEFKKIRKATEIQDEVFMNTVHSFSLAHNKLADPTKTLNRKQQKILKFICELTYFKEKWESESNESRDIPIHDLSSDDDDQNLSFTFNDSAIMQMSDNYDSEPNDKDDNENEIVYTLADENMVTISSVKDDSTNNSMSEISSSEYISEPDRGFNQLADDLNYAFSSNTNPYQKLVDIIEAFNNIITFIMKNAEVKLSDLDDDTKLYLLDIIISIIPPTDFVSAFVYIFDYWLLLINDESQKSNSENVDNNLRLLFVHLFNFAMSKHGNHEIIIYGEKKLYKNLLVCREDLNIAVCGNRGRSIRNLLMKRIILKDRKDKGSCPIELFLDYRKSATVSFFKSGKWYNCTFWLFHFNDNAELMKNVPRDKMLFIAFEQDDTNFNNGIQFIKQMEMAENSSQIYVFCQQQNRAYFKINRPEFKNVFDWKGFNLEMIIKDSSDDSPGLCNIA